jgi:uncharacterized integral membrane protein (TIGR00698 family)
MKLALPSLPALLARRRDRASWAMPFAAVVPGLLLVFSIAGLGFALSRLPYLSTLSPLILSILLGMVFHNAVRVPANCVPGVKFALRPILRLAIILLGLQLTIAQVAAVGAPGLAVVLTTLGATFFFTLWLGRRLGVDAKLAQLIATGTSICGASAVIAANTVAEGTDEDVAYAVACVTVFGTLAMFLYPALPGFLHLDARHYGLWTGASIHEIAQVVAAAFQHGREAGDLATITKLARVMLLAPVVILLDLALAYAAKRRAETEGQASERTAKAKTPFPWFVVGFIAMIGFNSLDLLPHALRSEVVQGNVFLLSSALAAMGLETDFRKLRAKGLRPFALSAGAWIFIACFSLVLVESVYR